MGINSGEVENNSSFGWNPLGKKMLVTRVDDNLLFEVDNMRVVDLYKKYLDVDIESCLANKIDFPLIVLRDTKEVAISPVSLGENGSLVVNKKINNGEYVQFSFGKIEYNIGSKNKNNRILKALSHFTNVTSKELRYKNEELERLNNMICNTVLYTTSDLEGNIVSVSSAYEKFTLLSKKDIIGKNHNIFRHPDTPDQFFDDMWDKLNNNKQFVGELKNKRGDGATYWVKTTIDPLFDEDGNKVGYSAYREDINEKKKLEFTSSHDSLTGLYNRREFNNVLKSKLKSAQRHSHSFGIIMLDIDKFKSINDKYGHKVGDEVLIDLSRCLSINKRDDDFLARWGGEEFIIIVNSSTIDNLVTLTKKLQNAISNISFSNIDNLTLSFGLTMYKEGDSILSLLKRSDDALYEAKNNGRDRYEIK